MQARGLVDELMTRVSNLSLDLRPAMLDDLGLLPALVWLFERYTSQTSIKVEFAHDGLDGRLSPIVETAAFRIVQEALTNVARHAAVPSVSVRVWRDGSALVGAGRRRRQGLRRRRRARRRPLERAVGHARARGRARRLDGRSSRDRRGHAPHRRAALAVRRRSGQDGRQRMKTRVLLADDHQVVIDGLKALLAASPICEVVGQATDGLQVLPRCSSSSPRCWCST